MQFLLSRHPKLQVFGQPIITFMQWGDILAQIEAAGRTATQSNRKVWLQSYDEPHYAGANDGSVYRAFARLIQAHYTAYGLKGKERWGIKSLESCANDVEIALIERLWGGKAKWCICIRDPFTALASTRSTFVEGMSATVFMERWIKSVKFALATSAPTVQIDLLSAEDPAARKDYLEGIISKLGFPPSEECSAFIEKWPVVHKVSNRPKNVTISYRERQQIHRVFPELSYLMERLGYRP